jgi:pimeloyl-ACP methyl ester carboxylesterase
MKSVLLVLSIFLAIPNLQIAGASDEYPEIRDQYFDSGGVRLRYFVVGKGEPVVLIHGWAATADMWRNVISDLSRDHQVIAFDCRGHGRSDKPHEPSQYGQEMVNDVTRLMDHVGIRKAHIAGYSMGGGIVAKLLTEHPERFLTAIIGGSIGFRASDPEWDKGLVKDLREGKPLSEAMIVNAPQGTPRPTADQQEMMKRTDAGQDSKALGAQRLGNRELFVDDAALKTSGVPMLFIYGGNDHPDRFIELKNALPRAEFVAVDHAGHAGAVSHPEFVKGVRQFLEKHPASRTHASSDSATQHL